MRDNWCIGYSSDFTVGAWVGNFSGEPMWNVSGISGAAPLWVEMMNFLHKDKSSKPPVPPTGIQKQMVRFSGSAAWKEEWFLEGTVTDQVIPGDPQSLPGRIAYPAAGTVVVLDPDIPTGQQKMYFEASPPSDSFHWFLDEEKLGTASNLLVWTPTEGIHRLKLVEEKGLIVDQVTFFVRGFQEEPETEKHLSEETLQDPSSQ
jgi:penicillin-binding protein 1C